MPRLPIDYSRTVIYKIIKNDDFENANVYIGSTTNFIRRKREHKNSCNNENDKSHNFKVYKIIRENGGWSEWSMIELEKYPCNGKREAESREKYWYKFYNAKLNSNIMFATPEELKQYRKQYQYDNKKKIEEYQKQKMTCECGALIRYDSKNRHKKTQKHIKFMNFQ